MAVYSRRRFLGLGATVAAGTLAGCASGTTAETATDPDADVLAGPDAANVFEPERLTVGVGDTVTWAFVAPGHNVSAVPDHGSQVSLPDGVDPFASYGADGNPNETEPQGTTYEHTFETPGEYGYVCVPHQRVGMVGTVVVDE
jgi:plastocyanin